MRGRAIRSTRSNPSKTGNIWHLACVDISTQHGGDDVEMLKRRFKTFVGISNRKEATIENGIRRLNFPIKFDAETIKAFNNDIIDRAGKREVLRQRWINGLARGVSLTEEIKIPFPADKEYNTIKTLYYNKTIANTIAALSFNLLNFSESLLTDLLWKVKQIHSLADMYRWLLFTGLTGVIYFGRQANKTGRIYLKYRDISKDIQKIGETLLASLIKIGAVQTEPSQMEVVSSMDIYGVLYCHLEGGTTFEKSTFIQSLQEIIASVNNPRYIIVRKSLFLKIISQNDYHSVPELIGRNKKTAEYFEKQWKRKVGSCELIYTRTIEGRKILLRSRINSLSSEFEQKSERINKWR